MNEPEPLLHLDANRVRRRGRDLTYFAGCDYFRLSRHSAVLRAAGAGLSHGGLNTAASRLTTGNRGVYGTLEAALARFFAAEAALLVSSGYVTSTMVAQALAGECTHGLLDERAHPALQDAALHLHCRIHTFAHRSPEALQRAARRCGNQARLLVMTDGLFSLDGVVAPLRRYLHVLPGNARLLVDDAHGAGVLGRNGRGTIEHEGIGRERVIQCVTLSKAFGVYGGAVLGSRELRSRILERSRAFVGSTPLPPHLAHATLTALQWLRQRPGLRDRLHHNTAYVRDALRRAGCPRPEFPGPIITWLTASPAEQRSLRRRLLAWGIFPSFLRYPGAAEGVFRFVISSEHTREQLDRLVAALTGLKAAGRSVVGTESARTRGTAGRR